MTQSEEEEDGQRKLETSHPLSPVRGLDRDRKTPGPRTPALLLRLGSEGAPASVH